MEEGGEEWAELVESIQNDIKKIEDLILKYKLENVTVIQPIRIAEEND